MSTCVESCMLSVGCPPSLAPLTMQHAPLSPTAPWETSTPNTPSTHEDAHDRDTIQFPDQCVSPASATLTPVIPPNAVVVECAESVFIATIEIPDDQKVSYNYIERKKMKMERMRELGIEEKSKRKRASRAGHVSPNGTNKRVKKSPSNTDLQSLAPDNTHSIAAVHTQSSVTPEPVTPAHEYSSANSFTPVSSSLSAEPSSCSSHSNTSSPYPLTEFDQHELDVDQFAANSFFPMEMCDSFMEHSAPHNMIEIDLNEHINHHVNIDMTMTINEDANSQSQQAYDEHDYASNDNDSDKCSDAKKQRLARKAELARVARKKKKSRLEELEQEVRSLKAELAHASSASFTDQCAPLSSAPHVDSTVCTNTCVPPVLSSFTASLSTPHTDADYQFLQQHVEEYRWSQMQKHQNTNDVLKQIEQFIPHTSQSSTSSCSSASELIPQFYHWFFNQPDKFYVDERGLWNNLLKQELQCTPQQMQDMQMLKAHIQSNRVHAPMFPHINSHSAGEYGAELEHAFQYFQSIYQHHHSQAQHQLNSLIAILNPVQFLKLNEWIQKFGEVCIKINV